MEFFFLKRIEKKVVPVVPRLEALDFSFLFLCVFLCILFAYIVYF